MEHSTESKTGSPDSPRPELVRPTEGRLLAGVAQGLASRLDITPWVVRVVFVITTFAGGLGIALYAVGWALMRSEDELESPAERFFGDVTSGRSWVGVGLIFIAALILLDNLTFLSGGVVWAFGLLIVGVLLYTGHISTSGIPRGESNDGGQQMSTTRERVEVSPETRAGDPPAGHEPPPPAPTPTPPLLPPSTPKERSILGRLTIGVMLLSMGTLAVVDNIPTVAIDASPRHYLALAVVVLGLGLVAGAFVGRARWLIIVGAILVPTMMLSPILEYDWTSETFDTYLAPTEFSQVEEVYTLDVGSLVIDLTSLPWDGETIEIEATVDAGNLEIWLPEGVGIIGEASVDVGRVSAPGRESAGLGDPRLRFDDQGDLGTVLLDASVDVGNIEIQR